MALKDLCEDMYKLAAYMSPEITLEQRNSIREIGSNHQEVIDMKENIRGTFTELLTEETHDMISRTEERIQEDPNPFDFLPPNPALINGPMQGIMSMISQMNQHGPPPGAIPVPVNHAGPGLPFGMTMVGQFGTPFGASQDPSHPSFNPTQAAPAHQTHHTWTL